MRSFSFSQSSSHVALLSLAASLGLASVSYAAPAPATPSEIVSVQLPPSYNGNYNLLTSTTAAGVAPYHVDNFNVLNTNYSRDTGQAFPTALTRTEADLYDHPGTIVNSTGSTATSITGLSLEFDRNEGSGAANPFGSDGDQLLASGDNFSQSNFDVSLALTGLNAADSYDLIAYVAGNYFSGSPNTEVDLTGSSTGAESEAFTPSSNVPSFMNGVNYVEFDNLAGNTSLNLSIPNTSVAGFGGFQLIDNGPTGVPEPASLGLLMVGGIALAKRRRRA